MFPRIANASDNNKPITKALKGKESDSEQFYEQDFEPISKKKNLLRYLIAGMITMIVIWALFQAFIIF
jgi:hypothetical protein